MNSMELVRYRLTGARPRPTQEKRAVPLFGTELAGPVRRAILHARQFLVGEQRHNGLWVGRQSADASLASLLLFWLAYSGREHSELAQQCAATILNSQTPTGGWSRSPDGSDDVSVSVQGYFALKLFGIDASSERMARARQAIRKLGGADAADATTRLLLAIFDQVDYRYCPGESQERLLFERSCQSRDPQAIVRAQRPVCEIEVERGVRELFIGQVCDWPLLWKSYSEKTEQNRPADIRELRFDELVWHMFALRALGVSPEADELQVAEERLSELVIVDDDCDSALPQHHVRPLRDTAVVVHSLIASGLSRNHAAIMDAADAFCSLSQVGRESLGATDLCANLSFHHSIGEAHADQNELPPHIEVCWAWSEDEQVSPRDVTGEADSDPETAATVEQLLTLQNPDGGWGERKSSPRVTGTVLQDLYNRDDEVSVSATGRAIAYLKNAQSADGSWPGGSGLAQIHATSYAARGLLAAGVAAEDDAVAAGVNWLIVHQLIDGGWCELPLADRGEFGPHSSPSPTSWALLALVAAGKANHPAVRRGVSFLVDSQADDGRWHEQEHVHFDAAGDRWIGNDLYSVALPLLALSRWAVAAISAQSAPADELSLRLADVSTAD